MNSISESLKNNPIQLNNIIPLDFDNIAKLPDSHTWTCAVSSDHFSTDPLTQEISVPVIDLSHPHAIALIREAGEKWGTFQVINHGIPIHLLHRVEHQTKTLFALPANQKLLAVRSPDGFTGYGRARISTFFTKQMWHEGFTIMGSPVEHASQLWPHNHTNFCDVMEEYQKEMEGLSERIIGLLLKSLGLTQEDLKWLKPEAGLQAVLQLNSYPVCPDPAHAIGLAPHTDSSLLTLLYQSNINGLQVLGENNCWVPVQPVTHALVVNIGDLMHIVSNGRFKSALHRAVVNKISQRVSVAYFCGPPWDAKISPLMKLIDLDHPILYRPVTWKEYLDAKATHFHKALESIKFDAFLMNRFKQL